MSSTSTSLLWCVLFVWLLYLKKKTPLVFWPFYTKKAQDFPFSPILLLCGFLSLAMVACLVGLEVEDGLGFVLGGLLGLCCLLDGDAKGGVFRYLDCLSLKTLVGWTLMSVLPLWPIVALSKKHVIHYVGLYLTLFPNYFLIELILSIYVHLVSKIFSF